MNKPVNVLMVEDSDDDTKLALRALRRGGFDPAHRRVQTAADLTVALAQERWDAVISDFNMPGFTGMEALGIFGASGLDIPFILVSGTIGEETAVAAMKAGASDYVMKENLARLAPALERELKEAQMRAAHRQALRELVESEQRLRTIIETEPECVKVVSKEGALLDMNAAGLAMLEADSIAAVRSRTFLDFIVPENRAAFIDLHQRVMRGERGTLEYEVIGLKGGRRWLETHAAPLGGANGDAAMLLGITRDITKRKRDEGEILATRNQLQATLDAVPDLLLELGLDGRYYAYHSSRVDLLSAPPEALLGRTVSEILPTDAADAVLSALHEADEKGQSAGTQFELLLPQGRCWFELSVSRMATAPGQEPRFVCLSRDITERKEAVSRISRLNRVYAVLSGINALIVRVRERDELFRGACRIAVEAGGFRMTWIGMVDRTEMRVLPVASAGSTENFLALVNQRFSLREETPHGNTLSARAVREKRCTVSNDVQNDPLVAFKAEHAQRGSRSMAILPLLVADEAVGIFALYSEEAGFFDDEELRLLTELAGNIAFAIDHLDQQARLDYLASYDELTGLANRCLFLERVAAYLRNAASGGHRLAVFLVDLERFRDINDSLGRPAGDALLQQVGRRLTRTAGDASLLARVGADQFAVVLPEVKQDRDMVRLLEKMIAAFVGHPFRLGDAVFQVAPRVGVALFPGDGADADTLLRHAEAALKKAKVDGERYLLYTQAMTQAVAGRLSLENQLRQALANEEFVLHYQPKVSLASGRLTGAEALLRWQDPRTGLVPPGRFIPLLEEMGLIHDVGRWVLRQAIADSLRWRRAGLAVVRIAVNLSSLQLRHPGFVAEITQAIGSDPQVAAGLELELTESLIMADVRHSIATLQALRALGVGIAIDDFGTGFSSLSYLARLPVDALKIDRSFVTNMTAGPEGLALVQTIINLAHAVKLNVVAEGVETEEQERLLRLLNCDEMQGFLFSKPVPAEIFEARFLAAPAAG